MTGFWFRVSGFLGSFFIYVDGPFSQRRRPGLGFWVQGCGSLGFKCVGVSGIYGFRT